MHSWAFWGGFLYNQSWWHHLVQMHLFTCEMCFWAFHIVSCLLLLLSRCVPSNLELAFLQTKKQDVDCSLLNMSEFQRGRVNCQCCWLFCSGGCAKIFNFFMLHWKNSNRWFSKCGFKRYDTFYTHFKQQKHSFCLHRLNSIYWETSWFHTAVVHIIKRHQVWLHRGLYLVLHTARMYAYSN